MIASALKESEIGENDMHIKNVGDVMYADLMMNGELFVVSKRGVLATINQQGKLIWRHSPLEYHDTKYVDCHDKSSNTLIRMHNHLC